MSDPLVRANLADGVLTVTLDRPHKRNAINDALLAELDGVFTRMPEGTRVIVLHGAGDHFCAGLDLAEHRARAAFDVVLHSQNWHRVFQRIQNSGIPVIAALHGAVIGGGLELASSTHVRVAEPDTIFQLPEGSHGMFVGGGASVRTARIVGAGRLCEMMLTGRQVDANEGQQIGLVHHRSGKGEGLATAHALAARIARNSLMANWTMITAIHRIANMAGDDGLYTESLAAALTQTDPQVNERIGQFLDRKKQ